MSEKSGCLIESGEAVRLSLDERIRWNSIARLRTVARFGYQR